MTITIAKHNKDSRIIMETEEATVTFKAKLIMKTSEIAYTDAKKFVYTSEVFEAIFLKEEDNKEKIECEPVDISSLFKKEEASG